MAHSPDPIVPRSTRRRSDPLTLPPTHPIVTRVPIQPPAPLQVSPTPSSAHRRWPLALRVLLWLSLALLSGITVLGGLVLAGQTQLVAWIIVGMVLTVVFGTPLLCVVGLFAFYVWAVTRMGRSRRRKPSATTDDAPQVAQTIIVGEVVID